MVHCSSSFIGRRCTWLLYPYSSHWSIFMCAWVCIYYCISTIIIIYRPKFHRGNLYCSWVVRGSPQSKLKNARRYHCYTHIIELPHVFEPECYTARLVAYLPYTTNIADGPTDGSRILLWRVRLLSAARAQTAAAPASATPVYRVCIILYYSISLFYVYYITMLLYMPYSRPRQSGQFE